METDPLQRLDHTMDALRAALLSGDLLALAPLEAILTAESRSLAAETPADSLARLRGKAAQNEVLLAAALRGLRSAQRRMAEIEAIQNGFSTYDHQGLRQAHSTAMGDLARRF